MSNMSYCRFRNTLKDLNDCKQALEDLFAANNDEEGLSRDEAEAAKDLVRTCTEIVDLLHDQMGSAGVDFQELYDNLEEVIDEANEGLRAAHQRKMHREEELEDDEDEV